MKRLQKAIIIILHIFMLLACLFIVLFWRKLAGDVPSEIHETTTSEWETPAASGTFQEQNLPEHQTADTKQEQDIQHTIDAQQATNTQRAAAVHQASTAAQKESDAPAPPPILMLASDLHYMSQTTHDDGIAFQYLLETDDGKISQYSDEIVDALLEEALQVKPSALLLAGDITLNGELENHLKLAEKLQKLQDAGVPVLVIPGNHDINNPGAATYFGTERKEAAYLKSGEEFYEIYQNFGYNQALSRDENSLSYLYELDETHWLMLLDSCQYEDYNHVNGRLKSETLAWMKTQLNLAAEQNIQIIVAAHHNLLSESRLYTTDCTLENHLEVIDLLEHYEVPLYISGHLHAQRIKKHLKEPGSALNNYSISEIVLSPYSLPPCQYGMLKWDEFDGMIFETKAISLDDNCSDYIEFSKSTIRSQVKKTISGIPDDLKEQMANLYAEVYYDYCAGNQLNWDEIRDTRAYHLWERVAPDSVYVREMQQMAKDAKEAQHEWVWAKSTHSAN